jgi:hypothetical protein
MENSKLENQIEEMAKVLCEDYGECKKCTLSNPECENPCMVREDCERLYNQGYRKSQDVAREIIEELEKAGIFAYRYPIIAELKKKYTEDK